MRPRLVHGLATEAVTPTTDEILRAVSSALRRDRTQVRALASTTLARIQAEARTRAGKELDGALAQLRGASGAPGASAGPRAPVEPRGARLAAPVPLPALTLRPVKIRLPDNRWVRGHLAPAAARRDDLEVLRAVTEANTTSAFLAIQHNAHAIDSLADSQRQLAKIVAELQARGDPQQLRLLFDAIGRLERRMGRCVRTQRRALDTHRRAVSRQQGSLRKALRLQARGARIQKLSATATTMQAAAFGTSGKLLARNNLLVAGNDLLWGFFGELLELLGLKHPGQTSAWGWLAPVASLVTSQVALGRQQHQRFITGVATNFTVVGLTAIYQLSLERHVAPALWPSFRGRDDLPVTTTMLGPFDRVAIEGRVQGGVLIIAIVGTEAAHTVADLRDARVAWMVDTGDANG